MKYQPLGSQTFVPLKPQDGINILIKGLLGENWYVTNPLCNTQVNAIAVEEILYKYNKNAYKRLCDFNENKIKEIRNMWTEDKLKKAGYEISNCKITEIDLSMQDHGCITLNMVLEGQVCVVYGGICLGHGYLGCKPEDFDASDKGLIYIMRIMDTIGVSKFNDLKGRYCRVAHKGLGSTVKIIGNIIKDQWFDPNVFFGCENSQ